MTDEIDRLRLARTEGVGPVAYRRLMERFSGAAAALDALPGLARAGGRATSPTIPTRQATEREFEKVARFGAQLIFLGDALYPPLLALLDDAPPVIAVLGDPGCLSLRAVALVGARNASANGRLMAENLAESLAQASLAVVSGLARGIDAAAHAGALRGGVTIACIAGGIDVAYPPEHAELQAKIGAAGCVVAEAPPGTAPQARHFPRRNRLIAGLSLGVVVVEAALRSGSLITARLAQEAGRELFAVPGSPLDPRCRGSNSLLREGATLTETAADVIDNLPDHPMREGLSRHPLFARGAPPAGLAEQNLIWGDTGVPPKVEEAASHATVLQLLSPTPGDVDDLTRRCQLSAAAVQSVLLDLELAGRIERFPGNRVALLSGDGF